MKPDVRPCEDSHYAEDAPYTDILISVGSLAVITSQHGFVVSQTQVFQKLRENGYIGTGPRRYMLTGKAIRAGWGRNVENGTYAFKGVPVQAYRTFLSLDGVHGVWDLFDVSMFKRRPMLDDIRAFGERPIGE